MAKRVPVTELKSDDPIIVADVTSDVTGDSAGGDIGGTAHVEPELIYGFETVEPASTSGSTNGSSDSGTRRRGRPPGSTNSGGRKKATNDLTGLEELLLGVHVMGAALCNTPELELADEEAKKLAAAANRVSAFYDHKLNPKMMAWASLIIAAGAVYGPRAIAIRARINEENRKTAGPRVINMPPTKSATTNAPAPAQPQTPADIFGFGYSGEIPAAAGE